MTRTSDDSWDLKTSVGATATMVAAARAVASRQPDPLIVDPFAEVFVRAVGLRLFTQIVDGRVDFAEIGAGWFPPFFGIRTSAIDDRLAQACRAGIRQAVIVASGLDCRAYRLDWPPAMALYEIDQPQVIDWKNSILAKVGCTTAVQHRSVGIDLRRDWPTALRQAGFDSDKPTVWVAEGLLVGYLPTAAEDEILDAITALSAPGSRIVADHFDSGGPDIVGDVLNDLHDIWRTYEPDLNLHDLTFRGPGRDPAQYLSEHGWTTRNADFTELLRAAGRSAPAATEFPDTTRFVRLLIGIRD